MWPTTSGVAVPKATTIPLAVGPPRPWLLDFSSSERLDPKTSIQWLIPMPEQPQLRKRQFQCHPWYIPKWSEERHRVCRTDCAGLMESVVLIVYLLLLRPLGIAENILNWLTKGCINPKRQPNGAMPLLLGVGRIGCCLQPRRLEYMVFEYGLARKRWTAKKIVASWYSRNKDWLQVFFHLFLWWRLFTHWHFPRIEQREERSRQTEKMDFEVFWIRGLVGVWPNEIFTGTR